MKKKVKFKAAKGAPYNEHQIQTAGEFLYKKYEGTFTPKEVLEAARPKSSPIHDLFDWNDTTAAEKWRQRQAGNLVRSIIIIVDNSPTRAFVSPVNIEVDGENITKGYLKFESAIAAPYIWEQVLNRALEELESYQLKYQHLKELNPIFSALNQINKERKDGKEKGDQKGRDKSSRKKS